MTVTIRFDGVRVGQVSSGHADVDVIAYNLACCVSDLPKHKLQTCDSDQYVATTCMPHVGQVAEPGQ